MADTKLLAWEKVEKAATILKAVAHPVRLRIVELLRKHEMSVGEIQTALGISQSLTSQQLNLLKSRGILLSRKNGNQVYYDLALPEISVVIDCLKKC